MEHFIREVSFANVTKSFGFVVPTPTQPEVFKVEGLSWPTLETRFTMALFELPKGGGGGQGFGSGHGRLGVEVLSAKRVGSFAAFVLRATDEKAMRGWLDRNKFTTTPASEAWLARYVKLGFYFVALRFEPSLFAEKTPDQTGVRTSAETLRISFKSPIPFYPYQEPDRDDLTDDRVMALWFITNGKPKIPVALVRSTEGTAYKRPWREGIRRENTAGSELASILGEKTWKTIAPGGADSVLVQTFEDQKQSRRGFGDVLLVPEEEQPIDEATRQQLRPLLPLLDPDLGAP